MLLDDWGSPVTVCNVLKHGILLSVNLMNVVLPKWQKKILFYTSHVSVCGMAIEKSGANILETNNLEIFNLETENVAFGFILYHL